MPGSPDCAASPRVKVKSAVCRPAGQPGRAAAPTAQHLGQLAATARKSMRAERARVARAFVGGVFQLECAARQSVNRDNAGHRAFRDHIHERSPLICVSVCRQPHVGDSFRWIFRRHPIRRKRLTGAQVRGGAGILLTGSNRPPCRRYIAHARSA
jgi:hypothetical protein